MKDEGFVLFEPLKCIPFEPHAARDRTGIVDTGGRGPGAFGRCQRVQPRGTELQLLDVVFVTQVIHAHVGCRDVVLRVVRDLPNVIRACGVEYECLIEISAYPARCRLDEASFAKQLGVVPIGGR